MTPARRITRATVLLAYLGVSSCLRVTLVTPRSSVKLFVPKEELSGGWLSGQLAALDGSCLEFRRWGSHKAFSNEQDGLCGEVENGGRVVRRGRSPARPTAPMTMRTGVNRQDRSTSGGKCVGRVGTVLRGLYRRVKDRAGQVPGLGLIFSKSAPPPKGLSGSPSSRAIDMDDVVRESQFILSNEDPSRPRRVLILMSDTGGGHRASAQALKAAFDELYPGAIDVEIVDVWTEHAPWPLNKFVESYQFMAKHPLLWKAFWEYGRFPPARFATELISNIQCHKRFRWCIKDSDPDLVVSVHPLCQDLPMKVMKKMGGGRRVIPFVTVVTDLGGAHPTWFRKDVDACFVPSNALARLAKACGLDDRQIRLHGLPIRPGFWSPA
ncbi:unnamed protein product, partial [Discosporangium mesarthrocarpum]